MGLLDAPLTKLSIVDAVEDDRFVVVDASGRITSILGPGTADIGKVHLIDAAGDEINITGGAVPVLLDKGGTITSSVAAPTVVAASMLALNASRKAAIFQNDGSVDVYMGPAGVTVANAGYRIAPGVEIVDNASTAEWYGITASGTGSVRIVEVT